MDVDGESVPIEHLQGCVVVADSAATPCKFTVRGTLSPKMLAWVVASAAKASQRDVTISQVSPTGTQLASYTLYYAYVTRFALPTLDTESTAPAVAEFEVTADHGDRPVARANAARVSTHWTLHESSGSMARYP